MTFRDTSADTTLDNANMGMREDFEKWAKEKDRFVSGICDGKYLDAFTSTAYRAWQARQPEIDALKAENERLRADAERYRWLRDKETPMNGKHHLEHAATECDSRIDRAMKDFSTQPKEE